MGPYLWMMQITFIMNKLKNEDGIHYKPLLVGIEQIPTSPGWNMLELIGTHWNTLKHVRTQLWGLSNVYLSLNYPKVKALSTLTQGDYNDWLINMPCLKYINYHFFLSCFFLLC